MKSYRLRHGLPYILGALLLVGGSGCNEELNGWSGANQSRFERTVTRQIVLDGTDTLDVDTRSGSIVVTGTDASECNLTAQIVAQAPTEEEAQQLAEQVEIVDQVTGSTLRIRSREPDPQNYRSASVSYTISIPRRMNIQCNSEYGSLRVSSIEGRVDGKSNNGSIKASDIQGPVDLDTSYGSVDCANVVGQSIRLHSNNGSIVAAQVQGSTNVDTSYGAITCKGFSGGDLRLQSGNGRIEVSDASFGVCDVRSSYGAVDASGLRGNSIDLHSGNGSIEIENVQAKKLDASSSYGRISATQIAVEDLTAVSNNGTVHVACASGAAPDLVARLRSSYGSIEFTAPPAFAGEVYLRTGNGSIHTSLPIATSGEITKQKIAGKIGNGTGKIRLESNNGSIELR